MWVIYDYCRPATKRGEAPQNLIAEWSRLNQKALMAAVNMKLRTIETDQRNEHGDVGPPPWVDGPVSGYPKLYKIKIQGGVKGANTRILVCRGPQDGLKEITLLFGAEEINRKWNPLNARDIALQRFEQVKANFAWRCPHEWVS